MIKKAHSSDEKSQVQASKNDAIVPDQVTLANVQSMPSLIRVDECFETMHTLKR